MVRLHLYLAAVLTVCLSVRAAEDLMLNEDPAQTRPQLDLIFMVHTSKKVSKFDFGVLKDFVKLLARGADVDSGAVRIGFANYRKRGTKYFDLKSHSNINDVIKGIDSAKFLRSKKTSLSKGLFLIRSKMLNPKMGDRQEVPNALIIITDEASNADAKKLKKSSQAVKKKNTKVYTIGVGMKDMSELQTAASDPSNVFSVDTMDDLMSVREQLVGKIKALQGDVSAFMPVFKTVGDLSATKTLDLVFLLHTSKKINRGKYQYYKDFISDIIRGADIDSGKVRVAVAAYRKRGVVIFNLKKYKTMDKVQTAVEGLKLYRSKVGSVAKGLDLVRGKILSKAGGDRPDVPNVVVLLTDAKSTVDEKKIKSSARKVRNAGTKIFAAGIGKAVEPQLKLIASSDDDAFSVASLDDLFAFKEKIVKQVAPLQQQDLPSSEMSVDDSTKADIAIVFHLSSGIAPANIPKYFVPFLKAILEKANIDGGDVRVSLTNFAKRPRVRFNLAKFKTSADVMKQINAIGRKDRARVGNGANALKNVRTKIFSKKGGDRPDAPNAVILIMDNKSVGNQKVFFREAEQLKATGAKIITVGMAKANAAELRAVASQPADDNAIFAKGYNNIASPDVIEPIRNGIRALLDEPATTVPPTLPAPTEKLTPSPVNLAGQDRADIVFAVHFNPRGSQADFDRLVSFLQSLIATSDVDGKKVRFGLYIDGGIVKFNLNKNPTNAALARALSSLRRREARVQKFDLERVLQDTRRRMFTPQGGDRLGVPNGLVVITDANSGQDRRALRSESRRAAEAGIGVYTLGIGLSDKGELENVASSSNNVFAFSDYNELERYGALLRKEIRALDTRQAPVPTTRPPPPLVEETTLPPPKSDCALGRADLIVVIDSSTSVTEQNFRKVRLFVKDFLSKADIDSGNVRVGVLLYSTEVFQIFQLNQYKTKRDVLRAVDRIPFRFGSTNTAGALRAMRTEMFTPVNGDRATIPNIVVVLTDGVSTIDARNTVPEALMAQDEGIHIYTIGVGLTDTRELDGIASPPARDNSFKVANFDELQTVDDLIYASACPKEFTMPTPKSPTTTAAKETSAIPVGTTSEGTTPPAPEEIVVTTEAKKTVPEGTTPPAPAKVVVTTEAEKPVPEDTTRPAPVKTTTLPAEPTREETTTPIPTPAPTTPPRPPQTTKTTTTTTTTTTRPTTATTTTTTPKPATTPRPTRPSTRRTTTRATTTTTTTTRRPTTTRRTTTTTRRTTTPRRIPQFKETGTDIIFMLDSSVNDETFDWMKTFVTDFTEQIDIDTGDWRVGSMTFDSRSRPSFQLNRYNFKDEIIAGIGKMGNSPSPRRPDVGGAFDYVRRSMFTSRQGDRPRARNYVVLLTGNEKYLNSERSYGAANRLKDLGTDVYTIGLNFRDTTDIDEISSKPTDAFRTIINSPEEMGEVPGIYLYRMNRAPPPTTRPTTTTTTTTTTRRPVVPYTGDCKSKADVIFLLDTSGSVGEYNYALMRNFTFNTVKDLEIDSGLFRVGVMTFSDTARIEFQLNTHDTKQDIFNALQRMPYVYGYTHTAEALRRIRTEMFVSRNGDRPDVPNLLVIVTDGHSNVNHEETIPEARLIKNMGTTIITVAIGLEDNTELRGMASQPIQDNMIEVMDFEGLGQLSHTIVTPLCSDADMCERNPCQNEGVCVDGLRSYICVCTRGFYGDNCENSCGEAADVVLILDSSTSVGSQNFAAIKSYAQRLVTDMEVLNCGINIGVMKYSSAAMIQFSLGYYDTEDEIIRAIGDISYTPGRSNMAEALRSARVQMFNGRNGDRYDARNIAYLLTDGSVEINRDITLSEAELVIDSGVRLIPLAVGLRDRSEIELIAETQGMPLMEIESEASFKAMSDQVLEAVHDTTSADDHCSPNPCSNGGVCIPEALGFSCQCAEGFSGETCGRVCNSQADVVFVVDSSRYNSGPEFRTMKRFLRDVVKRMAFRGGNFRVGIVEYGSSPRMKLSLLEGDNKRTVKSVIGSMRRVRGDPDLGRAASVVEYSLFGAAGDRKNVPNYAVLLTRSMGTRNSVAAINKLKAKGTKVIGVGIGLSGTDRTYMEAAVSSPIDETMFMANQVEDLMSLSRDFVNFVCEEKNMCAVNPCQNGGTCENGEKTYVCRCPTGFAGKDCGRPCDDRADVVFLIDSSGSVGFDSFRRIKEYIHHVVDSFNIGPEATQVGVATFSQSSRAHIYLDSYSDKRKLQAGISGINYVYGNTNTASGIKLARSSLFSDARGNRRNVPDFLFIITDGLSNVNHESTIPEAELARAQGIHIFAVGVGIGDPWELNGIASEPTASNVFQVDSWDGLWEISNQLIDRTCRDSGVCDGDPCLNGGTCVAGPGTFTCECRVGFLGDRCELDCGSSKDIAFILDASASVGPTNFGLMLKYVSTVVKDLTVGGQDHRFALITYSTNVQTIFSFNRYTLPEDTIEAIETTIYQAGSTNTADGLRQAIQMYQPGFGERPNAKDVVIFMTDGQSNINYWDTIPAATDLKAIGAKVIGIGIGLENYDEINGIASSVKDVFPVTSFNNLAEVEHDILEGSCSVTE